MLRKTKLCHSFKNSAVIMLALPINFTECKSCQYYAGQIDEWQRGTLSLPTRFSIRDKQEFSESIKIPDLQFKI